MDPVERRVSVVPGVRYRQLGVRLWGVGAYEREPIDGGSTRYAVLYRAEEDDVVVNKIWARNGSVAVAPRALAGCHGSNEFPTFQPRRDRLDPRWFRWYIRTTSFWRQCDDKSRGTSGKNRIRPERFLEIVIPLPPLDEQLELLARLEWTAAKLEEAMRLREDARAALPRVLDKAFVALWASHGFWDAKPIGEITRLVSGQVDPTVAPYAELPHVSGDSIEAGTCRLLDYRTAREDGVTSGKYHFPPGAILYSKIRPYLRKATQVPVAGICSADIYAFAEVAPTLEPRFLMYSLVAPGFTEYAIRLSGRTRMPKLNQEQLLSFPLRFPSRPEQRQIVERLDRLQAKITELRRLHDETALGMASLGASITARTFDGTS